MPKLTAILILSLFILSCSKEDRTEQQTDRKQTEELENPADTNLTQEERFSAAILVDFLNDSEDEDLASFLETEVYKMGAAYTGAAVIEATPSTWLLSLEKDGAVKNYLIQKYIDFKTGEYYFSMKESTLTAADILSKNKSKSSAGE